MRRLGMALVVATVVIGLVASARWSLQAQDRGGKPAAKPRDAAVTTSVQDAMLRPIDLPFAAETSLEDVRKFLARALSAPVVLDIAALDRLELTPADTVQLDLKGVRLKVGLKLLLDQVGLAYHVVPEDNLLILTDPEASSDQSERLIAEIKSLHRELHTLQDSVDDLLDLVEEDLGIEDEPLKNQRMIVRANLAHLRVGRGHRPTRLGKVRGGLIDR